VPSARSSTIDFAGHPECGDRARGSRQNARANRLSIDAAVSQEILRVVQPCALDAAALAVTQESHRHDELIEALLLELEAARYAEGLARKQYDAVDPDNRLVASELERRWNSALQKVKEIEARVEQEQLLEEAEPDRAPLGGLAADLEDVWTSAETDVRLKKRIIRTMIEEVVVENDVTQIEVALVIHGKGGVHSELRVPRRRRGQAGPRSGTDVVEAVRQLVLICDDKLVASILNGNGIVTAHGHRWCRMAITFTAEQAWDPRALARTPAERRVDEPDRSGGAPRRVAEDRPCAVEDGAINAMHPLRDAPWMFKRADIDEPAFRERFEKRISRQAPTGPDRRQLDLTISSTYRGEALRQSSVSARPHAADRRTSGNKEEAERMAPMMSRTLAMR
jgi:hypothetical protein